MEYSISYYGRYEKFKVYIRDYNDTITLIKSNKVLKYKIDRDVIKVIIDSIEKRTSIEYASKNRINVSHSGEIQFSIKKGERELTSTYSKTACFSLIPKELLETPIGKEFDWATTSGDR